MDGVNVNWWGLAFVVIGGLWLLDELGLFDFSWQLVGPIAIIAVGLGMLVKGRSGEGPC